MAAIPAYLKDHGKGPATLDDLVPGYLAEVPRPVTANGEWHYSISSYVDLTGAPQCWFELGFRAGGRSWIYSNRKGRWVIVENDSG